MLILDVRIHILIIELRWLEISLEGLLLRKLLKISHTTGELWLNAEDLIIWSESS